MNDVEPSCDPIDPSRPRGRLIERAGGKRAVEGGAVDGVSAERGWGRLGRAERLTWVATVVLCAILLLPRVVWAPLFGDPGEVQLTAAVGGIGHPPGQAGIISLFRLFCLISPVDPHLTVSAINAGFCLVTVGVLAWVLIRVGGDPLAVVLVGMLYLTDDQFWHAAVLPETYGTCFFLLAVSIWCWLGWLKRGGAWRFWVSVSAFVFLVANRAPTVSLVFPFALTAMLDDRARGFLVRHRRRVVAGVCAIGLVSVLVVVGSLWFRDVPGCAYNYLDQSWPSQGGFPPTNATWQDKVLRLWWLLSARQYDYMFHPTLETIRGQWGWLMTEFGSRYWPVALVVFGVVVFGGWRLWRRDRAVAVFTLAMIPATVLPILLIRVISNTTLFPNLLWPYALLFGVGLSEIVRWRASPFWRGSVPAAVVGVVLFFSGPTLLADKSEFDARSFVAEVNLEQLPSDATLLAFDVLPLIYTQEVYGVRPDVDILLYHGRLNGAFVASVPGRVFTTLRFAAHHPELTCAGSGLVCELHVRSRAGGLSAKGHGLPRSPKPATVFR